jgi:replication factor C subunit 3/5
MVEYLDMIIEKEKIRIDKEAKESILMIAKGDMRKVLNLLQSVSFMKEESIKEKDIYIASGLPIYSDMDYIIQILLNENLETSMIKIDKIIYENGYSLSDIIEYIGEYLKTCVIGEDDLKTLYKELSDIEYYLSFSSNEKVQCIHFISVFHKFQKNFEYKKEES